MYDFLIPNIYDIDQLLNSEQSSWKTFVSIKQLDWYSDTEIRLSRSCRLFLDVLLSIAITGL